MPDEHTSLLDERTMLQRRTVRVLAGAQMLGAIAFGVTVAIGSLLATAVSGDEAFSGLATSMFTLGAAVTAIPLARLASRRGRRWGLATGNLASLLGIAVVLSAASTVSFPLLLVGFLLIGAGNAANLQSRFAATDLASDRSRARDISFVVWATTIGAVLGPNLNGPGEAIGAMLGMPALTGAYVFAIAAQLACLSVLLVGLRPDPLLVARRIAIEQAAAAVSAGAPDAIAHPDRPVVARFAILSVAAAHAVMVAVMAMTPIHLVHQGATLAIVGLTISLHIAGMYALSPVFGVLADRLGRMQTIVIGQLILLSSLVIVWIAPENQSLVTVALVLLGLGWSAATVAGAALLSESSSLAQRTTRQGRSDAIQSLSGAGAAIAAGALLAAIGYAGLAVIAVIPIVAVFVVLPIALRAGRASVSAQ